MSEKVTTLDQFTQGRIKFQVEFYNKIAEGSVSPADIEELLTIMAQVKEIINTESLTPEVRAYETEYLKRWVDIIVIAFNLAYGNLVASLKNPIS